MRTFLVADVRGYTTFAQQRGDEAAAALSRRLAATSEGVIRAAGGRVVELRGDEVLAVFDSPRAAVRAAVQLQRRLVEETRLDPTLPLPVGIGLDMGEAVPVGGGFRANAINVAARLCAAAVAGEVLATAEVAHVAQAVDGVRYVPRPPHRLRGLAEPVSVRKVVAEAADPAREFDRLGFTRAAVSRRRAGFRLARVPWPAAVAAAALVIAAVVVAVQLGSGSGGTRLVSDSIGLLSTNGSAARASISVDAPPTAVAVGFGAVWVTSSSVDRVFRLDQRTHAVTPIPVGSDPQGVAVGAGSVWVANAGDSTVSRIDPGTQAVVATISVGSGPQQLVVAAGAVWVTDILDSAVSRIDPSTDAVTATIPVGSEPDGIVAGGGLLWVANEGAGTVIAIDPGSAKVATAPIQVGNGPLGVAFGAGALWVANSLDGTVARIDPGSQQVTAIPVQSGPYAVAVGSGRVWVSNEYASTISVIDAGSERVVQTVSLGNAPLGLAAASDGLWVAVDGSGAAVHRGGVLKITGSSLFATPPDLPSLDPATGYDSGAWMVFIVTNDGLVGFRRANGAEGATLVPDLATALPAPTDGGMTYTFHLRPGVRYSNGAYVQPGDFRYALVRAFELDMYPMQEYFGDLLGAPTCLRQPQRCTLSAGVTTDTAAATVTFHLSAPDPDFLYQLALPVADAVPPGTPVKLPSDGSVPSTGPYRVASYLPASPGHPGRLLLVRNPYFHEWSAEAQPAGFPDRIEFSTGVAPQQQIYQVSQGTADVMWDPVPASNLAGLQTRFPDQIRLVTANETSYFFFNTRVAPFNNLLVRRAVNFALDRRAADQAAVATPPFSGRITCQFLPPNFPSYVPYCPYTLDPSSNGQWTAPDIVTAQRLVSESGTQGMRVAVDTIDSGPDASQQAIAAILVGTLRELGYRAYLQGAGTIDNYFNTISNSHSRAQTGLVGWSSDYVAASSFINELASCQSFLPDTVNNENYSEFCDPSIDAQIRQALTEQTSDPGSATALWTRLDHELTDVAPWAAFSNGATYQFVSRRIGDYLDNAQWGLLIDQLWVR